MQDDQKKMAILGILVIVIIGVGAFQMMPQEPDIPASSTASKKWVPKGEEAAKADVKPVRNPSVIAPLARRDPFDAPAGADIDGEAPKPVVVNPPAMPNREITGMNPFPVDVDPLPGTTMDGSTSTVGNGTRTAAVPPAPAPTFTYTLSGVIIGRHSAAVFKDLQGNQVLIAEGAKIDSDSTLIQVRPGGVTVDVRGTELRVVIQGDKDAK